MYDIYAKTVFQDETYVEANLPHAAQQMFGTQIAPHSYVQGTLVRVMEQVQVMHA